MPTREPFLAYLRVHATMLRHRHDATSGGVERLETHAQALELLAELMRALPEDDERLLMLATLAVRHRQFVPGPVAMHALSQFDGTSREACDAFWTTWCAPRATTPLPAPAPTAGCHPSGRAKRRS